MRALPEDCDIEKVFLLHELSVCGKITPNITVTYLGRGISGF